MKKIDSETKFLWNVLIELIKLPFTLVLIIFGRKRFTDIFEPVKEVIRFVVQAKGTFSLIVINILVFIFTLFLSENNYEKLVLYPSDMFFLKIYTIITAGFLHANLSHLLWNMVALFVFGRIVEREFGTKKMFIIYFIAMIVSAIFFSTIHFLIFNTNIPAVGASGAIMGLVSAAILINPFYITWELIIPMPVMIVGWITVYADINGILSAIDDGIAHYAHLGGFISIAIIMFLIEKNDRKKLLKGFVINIISFIVFILGSFLKIF